MYIALFHDGGFEKAPATDNFYGIYSTTVAGEGIHESRYAQEIIWEGVLAPTVREELTGRLHHRTDTGAGETLPLPPILLTNAFLPFRSPLLLSCFSSHRLGKMRCKVSTTYLVF